ncbi:MAG: hypothetical protein JNK30_01680 [Phenylobacterium sp.]|uniref:glycosyltransferase n=1 Tax=Phenylobacterium sp. TaxID=1871053 RepID=UPI001A543AD9|nr:hypothetical protein [Phenylobacterium sp.]MBL8770066.1 hypothetical protein [Phenylobacterium sp.]
MTRVAWITFAAPIRDPAGGLTSDVASLRYRVLAPARGLAEADWSHAIVANTGVDAAARDAAADADVLVFSKSVAVGNEAITERARTAGRRVIFDICDDHFGHPRLGAHYRRMAGLADQVVCNTPAMAEAAAPFAARPPVVIPDPYEGPGGAARFAPGARLKLLWFGHPSNLDSLQAELPGLIAFARARPLSLSVLTALTPRIVEVCAQVSAASQGALAMTAAPWSLPAQWSALAACDAVVIPSRATPGKRVKSANRMVEALWAGRPVAAQPMPAYAPFAAHTPVRPTLAEGLSDLLADPAAVPARIEAAQALIAADFAPRAIARQWASVLAARA